MLPIRGPRRFAQKSQRGTCGNGPCGPGRRQACVMCSRVSAVSRCGSVLNVTR